MTITVLIGASFILGAVLSRLADRIEGAWALHRRDRIYAARFRAKSSVVSASFGAGRDGEK